MIATNFKYSAPETLQEAVALLADGEAKVLAGGMSLIPLMKLRLSSPGHLVDLSRLNLAGIIETGGRITIGAMTTHHEVESSPMLRDQCPLLPLTASNIGDVQIRNRGTIGGALVHADPSADYPAALLALDADVALMGPGGTRTVPVSEFLVDTFTTSIEPGEIAVAVTVPVEDAGAGVSYRKMLQPASGFAIVGVAARIRMADGKVASASIGVTGVGSKAYRASAVEQRLIGTDGGHDAVHHAVEAIMDGVEANSDIHAGADYRAAMARVYGFRAIHDAVHKSPAGHHHG